MANNEGSSSSSDATSAQKTNPSLSQQLNHYLEKIEGGMAELMNRFLNDESEELAQIISAEEDKQHFMDLVDQFTKTFTNPRNTVSLEDAEGPEEDDDIVSKLKDAFERFKTRAKIYQEQKMKKTKKNKEGLAWVVITLRNMHSQVDQRINDMVVDRSK